MNSPRSENRLSERILSEEDFRRMIALETEPRNRILLLLLYTAGLRVSEACNLRWRNLRASGAASQLTVCAKGAKTRSVLLPAAMWQDLLSLGAVPNPEAPVFRSRTGKALDRSRVLRIVQGAPESAAVSARTGYGTRMQHTASNGARRFTWCKLPWAMGLLRRPAVICTRDQTSQAIVCATPGHVITTAETVSRSKEPAEIRKAI